jgi:hypothetical protein
MNIKRAIGFGIMMWVFIFAVFSIIMFLPFLEGKTTWQYVIYWVVLIPMVLLATKWYFKADPPAMKKGFLLGVIGLVVGSILDLAITVPLFISQGISYGEGLAELYGNWQILVSFGLFLVLCTYAGWEFDATFTKMDQGMEENKMN